VSCDAARPVTCLGCLAAARSQYKRAESHAMANGPMRAIDGTWHRPPTPQGVQPCRAKRQERRQPGGAITLHVSFTRASSRRDANYRQRRLNSHLSMLLPPLSAAPHVPSNVVITTRIQMPPRSMCGKHGTEKAPMQIYQNLPAVRIRNGCARPACCAAPQWASLA